MGRYNYPKNTKIDDTGKTVYTSILYPKIVESNLDVYILSKVGDRFDLLAYKYYGDVTLWWIIAHANKIRGTFYPQPGTQLRIPMSIDQINTDLQDINS